MLGCLEQAQHANASMAEAKGRAMRRPNVTEMSCSAASWPACERGEQ